MHSAIRGFGWRRADRFFIVSSLGNRRGGAPSFGWFYLSRSISSSREIGVVIGAVSQHCPSHPGCLVRKRDSSNIGVRSISQVGDPATQGVITSLGLRDHGAGAVDEDAPQVRVTAFGDPVDQVLAASTRVPGRNAD